MPPVANPMRPKVLPFEADTPVTRQPTAKKPIPTTSAPAIKPAAIKTKAGENKSTYLKPTSGAAARKLKKKELEKAQSLSASSSKGKAPVKVEKQDFSDEDPADEGSWEEVDEGVNNNDDGSWEEVDNQDDVDLESLVRNPTENLLDEADDLLNSLLSHSASTPQSLPKSSSKPKLEDPKVTRAKQGLAKALNDVQNQLLDIQDMCQDATQDQIPHLLTTSKTLKSVKGEFLSLPPDVASVSDYFLATPRNTGDKLAFAQAYLQSEITGLQGIISDLEMQILLLDTAPPVSIILKTMMVVSDLMRECM